MNRYIYDGPVMYFNTCVQNKWTAETMAPSTKKARSNLEYRWKTENGYVPGSRISLPGKLMLAELGGDPYRG